MSTVEECDQLTIKLGCADAGRILVCTAMPTRISATTTTRNKLSVCLSLYFTFLRAASCVSPGNLPGNLRRWPGFRSACVYDAVAVTLEAGSMILFHERCFHGTLPNTGARDRAVFALGFRPAWAGPIAPVTEFNPSHLTQLPMAVRELIHDPNAHDGVVYSHLSKPEGMGSAPVHIGPSRHTNSRL